MSYHLAKMLDTGRSPVFSNGALFAQPGKWLAGSDRMVVPKKSMTRPTQTVLKNDFLRADMYRANADLLAPWVVVTFTERCNFDLDGPGFGTRFLLDEGFDVLAIKNARDDWYASLGQCELEEIARELKPYDRRACYGSSMGAFAAIKFAKVLGALRAIAISPIVDIRYEWDRRFFCDLPAIEGAGYDLERVMIDPGELSADTTYHLAIDPYCREDSRHAEIIAGWAPRHSLLKVPFGGHPVGLTMRDEGILSVFVLDGIKRDDTSNIIAKVPDRRNMTDLTRHALVRYLLERQKLKSAYVASKHALSLAPDWGEAQLVHGQILDRLHLTVEAIPHAQRAIELEPNNPYFVGIIAEFLVNGGYIDLAKQIVDDGIERIGPLDVLIQARCKTKQVKLIRAALIE